MKLMMVGGHDFMDDERKTKEQLIDELQQLRRLVEEAEQARQLVERRFEDRMVRTSEIFFDRTMDESPFAMWIAGADGTVVRTNRSLRETLGLTDDQIVGRYNVLNDRNLDEQGVMPMVEAVFSDLKPARFDIPWSGSKAGNRYDSVPEIYIDVSIFPIVDEAGALVNVVCQWVDITEQHRVEEELKQHRDHLEQLVQERTATLEATNRELEAFTYSVSHDLRAPLRSIDGFGKILLKHHASGLDEVGRDYLTRIRTGTRRMSRLIDDLLRLSRLNRAEIELRTVDLSAIAREIVQDLRQKEAHRAVEVVVEPGLVAEGDPVLLRAALENLIGNAWKFTGNRQEARIEFRSDKTGKTTVFFVRDNGAGFEMAYADKLFGAFQRLHDEREFPGMGIGLASVQRIVHRHGGRVWAEGEKGKGATFYFALNGRPPSQRSDRE
jgi:signal transduction histidine kinase